MVTNFRNRLLVSTVIVGAIFTAAPAFAQANSPQSPDSAINEADDDIVVTGSRIGGANVELSSPVSVISAKEFALRQPTSVEIILRQLPGSAPGVGSQVNNGQGGVFSFNLRGLGANRNLVLMNGRRVVPSTLGNVVDLNIIPIALLESAQVFTGGASTAYGADAIAGVVNFTTKKDFTGVDVQANMGLTGRGDGQSYRIDVTTGASTADGKGNVVLGLSYTNTGPVLQGDRDIGLVSRNSTCSAAVIAAGTCAAQTAGLPQGSGTAVPASLFFPLPATGPFAAGAQFSPATGSITPGLADFNFNPLNLFQTPQDRWNIYAAGHYEITPNVEAYAEAFYTRTRVLQNLAPTGTFTNAFQVPLNNQFLTATQRDQLCTFSGNANCPVAIAAGTEITAIVARRFVETGPRVQEFNSNVFQVTAGLRGKLVSNLNWDVYAQYGEANRRNTNTGNALFDRVQSGIRNCPAGSAAGCVPVNIFGAAGTMTPAMFNFISVPTSTFVNTTFTTVQGLVNGDFGVKSPFADMPISIAAGGEYRRYSGGQFGDLPSITPGAVLGSGGAFNSIFGAYSSVEGFGEAIVPLIQDKPFFYDLTLEGGARYSVYTTAGSNWTYKAGGSWSPVQGIKFRGLWSRAVRAPNLGELFAPVSTGLNNLAVDPCQLALPTGNATTTALCSAQLGAVGLPASRVGSIPIPIAGQINTTGGGNPALGVETATTLTLGAVFQPRGFLNGFTASVDWYRIQVRGAVTAPTISDIVNGCFGQANANDVRCQAIRRNPLTGGLSGDPSTTLGIVTQSSNLGFLESSGVDFQAAYQRRVGIFDLNWQFNGNYTATNRFQAGPGSILRECTNFYSVSCDPVLPQWSWNMRTGAAVGMFDFSVFWRHVGGTEYEPRTSATIAQNGTLGSFGSTNPATIIGAYRQIPAFNWFDLSVGANVTSAIRFSMLVENLLDRNPPDIGNNIGSTGFNSGNTNPSTYDPLGRRFTVAVGLRF